MDLDNFKPTTLASMVKDLQESIIDLNHDLGNQDNDAYNLTIDKIRLLETDLEIVFTALVANCGISSALVYID